MSASDKPRWPAVDRRTRDRRHAADRRRVSDRRNEAAWVPVPLDESGTRAEATLVAAAAKARLNAQAGYSGFKVGAALELPDGTIVTGCNIENATYGLTICAERVALVKALSDGHTAFTRIAVVTDTHDPTPPCGPCRQLLWEYCGDITVVMASPTATKARHHLLALLPMPFDRRLLK